MAIDKPPDTTEFQPSGVTELTQELRLATTITGGVSLAIWMAGVVRELNLLAQASEWRRWDRPFPTSHARGLVVPAPILAHHRRRRMSSQIPITAQTQSAKLRAEQRPDPGSAPRG
jgi:hypothetical protein